MINVLEAILNRFVLRSFSFSFFSFFSFQPACNRMCCRPLNTGEYLYRCSWATTYLATAEKAAGTALESSYLPLKLVVLVMVTSVRRASRKNFSSAVLRRSHSNEIVPPPPRPPRSRSNQIVPSPPPPPQS